MSVNIDGKIEKEYLNESLISSPSAKFSASGTASNRKLEMNLDLQEVEGTICETCGINDLAFTHQGRNPWFKLDGTIGSGDATKGLYIMCRLNLEERFKVLAGKTRVRYFMGSITDTVLTPPPKNGEYMFAIYRTQKYSDIPNTELHWQILKWNLVANTNFHKYNPEVEPVISTVYEDVLIPTKYDYWACFIKKNKYKEAISMPGRACSDFNKGNYVYQSLRFEGPENLMPEPFIEGGRFKNDIGQTFFVRFYNRLEDL